MANLRKFLFPLIYIILFCFGGNIFAQKVQPTNPVNKNNPKQGNSVKLAGEPIPGAEIYVELEPDDEPIFYSPEASKTIINKDGFTINFLVSDEVLNKHSLTLTVSVTDIIKFLKIDLENECFVDGLVIFSAANVLSRKPVKYNCNSDSWITPVSHKFLTIPRSIKVQLERISAKNKTGNKIQTQTVK